MIEFTVPGNPIPKARPRVIQRGKRTFAYTPRRTRNWEAAIRAAAWEHVKLGPLHRRPLAVTLTFYRENHVRADTDNLAKAVLDALNGICYVDDAQIVDLHLRRYVDSDNPRVEIRIKEALRCGDSKSR